MENLLVKFNANKSRKQYKKDGIVNKRNMTSELTCWFYAFTCWTTVMSAFISRTTSRVTLNVL